MEDNYNNSVAIELHKYIEAKLLNGQSITSDQDLLLSGILDSLSIMNLVSFIESQFELTIPFGDVVIENFMSIATMQSYIEKRQSDVV